MEVTLGFESRPAHRLSNRNWRRPRAFKPDTALGFRHERVGPDDCPYLERWLMNFGPFAIRLHHFFRSDEDHLHDHPWWFWTLVLRGSYEDWVECPQCEGMGFWSITTPFSEAGNRFCFQCGGKGQILGTRMRPGTIRYRPALHRHRVVTDGAWTLILSGRKSRDWGFMTPKGWMRQRAYFRKYGGNAACKD